MLPNSDVARLNPQKTPFRHGLRSKSDSKIRHKTLKKKIEKSMSLAIESAHLTINLTKTKFLVFQFNEVGSSG